MKSKLFGSSQNGYAAVKYFIILLFSIISSILLLNGPVTGFVKFQIGARLLSEINEEYFNTQGDIVCFRQISNIYFPRKLLKAIDYLQESIKISSNQSKSFFYLGQAYCLAGDYQNAVNEFDTFIQLHEDNPIGYLEKGFAQENYCKLHKSICEPGFYVDTWKSAGISGHDFAERAVEEQLEGDYSSAIDFYENAELLGGDVSSAISFAKYQFEKQNENHASISLLHNAIKNNKGWVSNKVMVFAWIEWGKYLVNLRNYYDAENAFHNAIDYGSNDQYLVPTIAEINRLLGNIKWQQNDLDRAKVFFEDAIRIYRNNVWAHMDYGKILFELDKQNLSKVDNEFQIAISIGNSRKAVLKNSIDFWISTNNFKMAATYCQMVSQNGYDLIDFPNCK